MNARKSAAALGILLTVLASFAVGTYYGGRARGGASVDQRRPLYYTCPMHPAYRSDRPGDCPSCGMRLVPVHEDAAQPGAGGGDHASSPGWIHVDGERQQVIGVRVGVVGTASGVKMLRTTGRVTPDERRLYRLNASTDFWVREVFAPTTGSVVPKNAALLSFYSANFLSTAASYMYALETVDRQRATPGANTPDQSAVVDVRLRQAVDGLKALGVSDYQIEEMARTRKIGDLVTLRSPIEGFVLLRNATLGEYIQPGTELYQIADLRRVWILADVFVGDARFIKPWKTARVTALDQGLALSATVSDVLPQFDAASRTLKVRLESDNPGYALRPGMFVDVEIEATLTPSLVVPADAVIDSGLSRTVFVDRGSGYFEPRRVETGWRLGDEVQVVRGLMDGERIVVSGTFLIDSESRMKAAGVRGAVGSEKDPVCGMTVDPALAKAAGRVTTHEDHSYYFCSDDCKKKFDKEPAKYGAK